MHECLLVDEIFRHIAERGQKGDAYRLALTCKALSESALDCVWKEIDGLTNLIYLLPSDLWHGDDLEAPGEFEPETSCMTRKTVASDWTRFLVHARRVKEFTYNSDPFRAEYDERRPWTIFPGNTVLRQLHEQCPDRYLLPMLLTLNWRNTVGDIHLCMCPTLQNLRLDSSVSLAGVTELLEAQAPLVTSLALNGRRTPTAVPDIDALSNAILRMARLTRFDCDLHIRADALAHLSRLPALDRLSIPFSSPDDSRFASAASESNVPLFPSLTALLIGPSEPTLLGSLIKGISSTQLEWMWWEITDTRPHSILDVAAILAAHPSRAAFKRVVVTAKWDVILGGLPPGLITLHAFEPLISLSNLTELNLGLSWLSLGNEDVEHIARSLPRLTALNLSASNGVILPPRITLRALLSLFKHCALQNLGIVVDATHNVPDEEFALPPPPLLDALLQNGRHLRRLDFGNSRIGPTKVAAITAFLTALVPRLTALTAWRRYVADIFPDPIPPPSSSPTMWKQVADMYGQLTLHEQSAAADSWQGFNM
ncbi:hypothetical protein C8R46DRAFT_1360098 [Mycena filopes]|nr:hypothetical protein C8R46DRAFT_1360098 [Mycena filopes]